MKSFKDLIEQTKKQSRKRCVVVCAEDETVLEGIRLAHDMAIILPVLVGNKKKINELALKMHLDIDTCEIHDEQEEQKSMMRAIALVKDQGDFLMKGMLSSSTFLKGVLNKDWGLRTGNVLSHIAAFEIPGYHKLLFMSDGGMNPKLDLKTRVDIINNAVDSLMKLGIRKPKVALVAASETVNPDMPETTDASEIVKLNRSGQISNCIIDGPFGFDVAISKKAAEIKRIERTSRQRTSGPRD
jgi:phosphate butyryltransferase